MRSLAGRISLRRKQVRHAITDLYDEERGTFLIQYPVWLVVALGLTGVIAFAVTGFWGYPKTETASLFGKPIVLLPWLFALQIMLELSILRDRSLRWQRFVVVGATLLSIGLLVAAELNSNELQTLIQQYLQHGSPPAPQGNGLFARLSSNPWTYVIVNFVILGIFWLDTARRWLRRALGLSPNPSVNLGLDDPSSDELPRIEDMVSGDLLAAGVLSLVLGLAFSPQVVDNFARVTGQPGLDWLSTFDIVQTLVTLPLGLIILALAAMLNGLGAVGGLETSRLRTPSAPIQGSARTAVSQEVSMTVLKTLQAALDRRLRAAVEALLLSLRNVLWPILILISTAGLGISAILLEAYLHDMNKAELPAIVTVVLALALGVLAALFTVFAAGLFLFSRRVATNSLRFLGLIGFVVLLTFWIFSLALSGFNLLLDRTGITHVKPFLPPAASTAISFLALVIYGALSIRRLMRRPQDSDSGDAPTTDTGALGAVGDAGMTGEREAGR